MNKTVTSIILLLILCLSVNAQDASYLRSSITDAIRRYEPSWELDSRSAPYRSENVEDETLIFHWKSGDSYVIAIIFLYPSAEEASISFDKYKSFSAFITEEKVSGLGDGSYYWKNASSNSKEKGVYFRKDKAVVLISSYSKRTAKEFAHHIDDCIPAA